MTVSDQVTVLERASLEWLRAPVSTVEPDWLSQQRASARAYLKAHGLPKPQDESFRFLPLKSLAAQTLRMANGSASQERLQLRPEFAASIGFADGFPIGEFDKLPGGLHLVRLQDLLATQADKVERYLGRLAKPVNGFAAVALALFYDAWVVHVREGVTVELPLEIVVRQDQSGVWSIPRLLVVLEPRSRLTIVEKQVTREAVQGGLSTSIFELFVGQGAELSHVRVSTRGETEAEVSFVAAEVAADAHYHSWVGSLGGGLTRLDAQVRLVGPGARVDLDGLYVARGRELVDHHTVVIHESPSTTATEMYRGILDDEAQAVFDGLIVVKPGAQQTNAQQYNRNLVLSDSAVVHTKPQLEIEADDVVCSHGATVGRLDEQQLFYLQSRGLSANFAKQLLTAAFANELIERCPHAALIPVIRGQVASHLGTTEGLDW